MASKLLVLACLLACTQLIVSDVSFLDKAAFYDDFGAGWEGRWGFSADPKYTGKFVSDVPEFWTNPALKIPEPSKHYGISALLPEPYDPSQGITVQYMVKYQEGVTCGGAYLKLVTHAEEFTPAKLVDSTPYSIMFGPDKCGSNAKVHVILRHKSPVTGNVVEKHLAEAANPATDSETHIYTLTITPDNTFKVLVDGSERVSGSLFDKFEPPMNPPKEIPDPSDVKPEDWVDEAEIPDDEAEQPLDWDDRMQIVDEAATKPAGWLDDESELVEDPAASKPEDWDDEEDGEWSPPMIPNPKCKAAGCGLWTKPMKANPNYMGKWQRPMMDNPYYKGPWVQKTIPNPDYFVDNTPLASIGKIGAVAIEVWTIDSGYTFGNIMITSDAKAASDFRKEVWQPIHEAEEAKSDAAQRASHPETSFSATFTHLLVQLFDLPQLKAVKPHVQPLLEQMHLRPWLAYVVLAGPLLATVALIIRLLSRAEKADTKRKVGRAKKEDTVTADDEGEEPSGEGEASAKKVEAHKDTTEGEGSGAKEGDEDEGEEAAKPRRRAGRA